VHIEPNRWGRVATRWFRRGALLRPPISCSWAHRSWGCTHAQECAVAPCLAPISCLLTAPAPPEIDASLPASPGQRPSAREISISALETFPTDGLGTFQLFHPNFFWMDSQWLLFHHHLHSCTLDPPRDFRCCDVCCEGSVKPSTSTQASRPAGQQARPAMHHARSNNYTPIQSDRTSALLPPNRHFRPGS
jgi:hypothetical protein